MTFVRAIGRFWWDFIVGDDWRIAVGVLLVLAAGACLVALDAPDALVVGGGSTAIVAVVVGSILRSVRR